MKNPDPLAESPGMPADVRIVAAWFPASERGTATQFFNTSQYFATVVFAPIMGWITYALDWRYVFIFVGMVGNRALGTKLGTVIPNFVGASDRPANRLARRSGRGSSSRLSRLPGNQLRVGL
jgi:MFS family permease